jgi:hypothetical protein
MESATLTRPRALPAASSAPWPLIGLGVLVVAAVVGFLAYPTYPNYDSLYSMLWGREILEGRLPVFDAYRAPTPHPLATFVGVLVAPLGHGAERVWIALCVIAFVALVVGVYRLTRTAFTPLVGLVAALLLCSRFDFAFYAARGYIDIGYMALVVWAAVLEAGRRRRGAPVLVLLALAGMLRPEAWVMAGLYFLWAAWPAGWADRVRLAALAALGPAVWVVSDWIVTGNPLWSLTYTSSFAEELGRAQAAGSLPAAVWEFLLKLDKLPVVLGGILGLVAGALLVPRRIAIPLVVLVVGIATFLLVGLAGFSVIDRYLLVSSLMMIVFCAVALAGWTMLEEGTTLRRAWAGGAAVLVLAGVVLTAFQLNLARLTGELAFRGTAHASLHDVLQHPRVRAGMRCGPVNVPNHKLIPDVRWVEDLPDGAVLARSQVRGGPGARAGGPRARALRRRIAAGGVQLVPHERLALLRQALVAETDDPATVLPLAGFRRVAVSDYYSAYVRCPAR